MESTRPALSSSHPCLKAVLEGRRACPHHGGEALLCPCPSAGCTSTRHHHHTHQHQHHTRQHQGAYGSTKGRQARFAGVLAGVPVGCTVAAVCLAPHGPLAIHRYDTNQAVVQQNSRCKIVLTSRIQGTRHRVHEYKIQDAPPQTPNPYPAKSNTALSAWSWSTACVPHAAYLKMGL